MSLNERIVKVRGGKIVGPKTTLKLSSKQKDLLGKAKDWYVLELDLEQSSKVEADSGVYVKEVFVILPQSNNQISSSLDFESIKENLGVFVGTGLIEIAHKNLNQNADFADEKVLLEKPSGSSIHKAYFLPDIDSNLVSVFESSKHLAREMGIEDETEKMIAFDLESIGEENWVLQKFPREFEYLKYTSPEERVKFAEIYNFYLTRKEFDSVCYEKPGNVFDIVLSDSFFEEVCFISYSERFEFAYSWWHKIISELKAINEQDSQNAKNWIKGSLLDAQELNYRGKPVKSDERKKHMEDFYSRRNRFHQQIVFLEKDSDDLSLRKSL